MNAKSMVWVVKEVGVQEQPLESSISGMGNVSEFYITERDALESGLGHFDELIGSYQKRVRALGEIRDTMRARLDSILVEEAESLPTPPSSTTAADANGGAKK